MSTPPEPPRRRHRAVVIIFLILFAITWLFLTFPNPASIDGRSLVALTVVVLLAAIGGIAFSWRRYFGRR